LIADLVNVCDKPVSDWESILLFAWLHNSNASPIPCYYLQIMLIWLLVLAGS